MATSIVRQQVLELYHGSNPEAKKLADNQLQQFQATPQAWQIAQELMGDSEASVQFFGAQTVYNKVQRVAKGYDALEDAQLKVAAGTIQQHILNPSLSMQAKQRLVLAIAAIAVHLCAQSWQTAIDDILTMLGQQPKCTWGILLAIPEQLSDVVHTYLKTDKRTQALLAKGDLVVAAALAQPPMSGESHTTTGTLSDSPFSLALQTLTQWSKVMGLPLLEQQGFADILGNTLTSGWSSSVCMLELLIEVLSSNSAAFALYGSGNPQSAGSSSAAVVGLEYLVGCVIRTMSSYLGPLEGLAAAPPVDFKEGPTIALWARVAVTMVEAYTQILWLKQDAAEVVTKFLTACFLIHPSVCTHVFELWAILKDAKNDGKLPGDPLSALLRQLGPAAIKSLATFGRADSRYSEDEDALQQQREASKEVVVDVLCIAAGTPEGPWLLSSMQQILQQAENNKDLPGLEVMWYAFSGVAEALADEPTLPEVYRYVVQSILRSEVQKPEQCETAAILLRTCGPHFLKGLQPELASAVQWLVYKVSVIPDTAAEAVQEICGYAGQHLVQHVDEFLKVVEQVAPKSSPSVDASLRGALAGIARNLSEQQVVPALSQICSSSCKLIQNGLDITQESGREQLHRFTCVLLRSVLVVEQGGNSSGPGKGVGDQASMEERMAGTCLATILLSVWSDFAPAAQRLLLAAPVPREAPKGRANFEFSDEALQVNVLALLRTAGRAACNTVSGGPELGSHLVNLAAACAAQRQLACLHSLSVLALSVQQAKTNIAPQFGAICVSAFGHIQAGGSEYELVPFLDLISSMSSTLGDELFQCGQVETLVRLCILALAVTETDVLKPVLNFLQRLLSSTSPALTEQLFQDMMRAILANFHKWPRMLGAQNLKLFNIFIERQEAAFVSMVTDPSLPCLACLPAHEQAIAQQAFRTLRGPRLRAFLGDLGTVARSENSPDVLHAYS